MFSRIVKTLYVLVLSDGLAKAGHCFDPATRCRTIVTSYPDRVDGNLLYKIEGAWRTHERMLHDILFAFKSNSEYYYYAPYKKAIQSLVRNFVKSHPQLHFGKVTLLDQLMINRT